MLLVGHKAIPAAKASDRHTVCASKQDCALERRAVSWAAGSAATKLCAGDSPCGGNPPSGESPPVDPCQLSFEMPCGMRVAHVILQVRQACIGMPMNLLA